MGAIIDNKSGLFIQMNDINNVIINFNLVNSIRTLCRNEPISTNGNTDTRVASVYYIDVFQIKNTHNLKYKNKEMRDNDMIKLNEILNIIN